MKILFSALLLFADIGSFAVTPAQIEEALRYQKSTYPAAQLRDVYKLFMQDYFGPGHILADTSKAKAYLDSELVDTTSMDGPLYEPTGAEGNFYRVNLSVIHDGKVDYDTFFGAFVRSVQAITPPTLQAWTATWAKVEEAIECLGYHYDNEVEDRQLIRQMLDKGNFVMHHSDAYNRAYHFKYRIISREEFDKLGLNK